MEKTFRKTGIDIIGDTPWGTHLCQFYQTKKDLIDILVPYFKAGLENNEFCMWITSESLKVEDAKAALKKVVKNLDHFIKKGQIEILDYSEWYTKSGKFDANNVLQGWIEKENQALKRGYDGLRLSGNTFWLGKRDWRNFTDYEEEINNVIGKYRMIAICTYFLGKCGASEVIDVVSNHQFALVRREGEWVIIESSERKRAEKTLQSSEANLRKIIEKNADSIVIVDRDGLVRYVNPATEALFGRKAEELIGELFGFPLTASEATEIDIIRRDGGGIRVAEVRVVEMEWEEKNAYLASVHDITERKRAEEALRKSEEKYRTILENIEEGYFEVDIGGNFTFFNDSLCRLFGYSRDEMMGMNNRQYTDQENAKKLFQTFNKVYRIGEPTKGFDWEIIRKDGAKRYIETSVSLIKNSSGQPIGFRGVVRDITERKRAEEALRTSQERFRQLFDGAPIGYHEIDSEGRFTRVNRTESEMLGYTVEEMLGQPAWNFIVEEEESRKAVAAKLAGVVLPFKGLECTYRRKDGTTFPVIIEDLILRDSEGRIIGIRSTIQDITERKRAEEEMAALQEQLRQSQKMEAIGRLAGGIAHDFNNLLTVIKGYSQLSLIGLKESDPIKGNMEEIRRATDRAADLIRQLLAFSRRQVMEMRVLNLNILLQNLDKMLRRVIGEDIELVTLLAEDLGRVKTDPGQIEQVILNLAVNARDAMLSGGKLTIETANVELDEAYARRHVAVTPGRYVMLAVSDTGVGMTPEVRERIFEPFFTTKEEGKGTGLGLSTVYGIVKQSGGNIWVYSEPEKGTTFKIYLPLVNEPLEEKKERVVKEASPRGNETILVVEDDEVVRKLAVRILREQGYRVLEASQGVDAFLICEQHKGPIHLLVTDVVMPKMSGREVAERLASIRPGIKVLYMSGYTDNTIARHGILDKGMNFIQKPFTVEELARKVREVLDK